MLWNFILIAGESAETTVTPDVTIGEEKKEHHHKHHHGHGHHHKHHHGHHHKARRHRHHGVSKKKLTHETDAITRALNAGALPVMPKGH